MGCIYHWGALEDSLVAWEIHARQSAELVEEDRKRHQGKLKYAAKIGGVKTGAGLSTTWEHWMGAGGWGDVYLTYSAELAAGDGVGGSHTTSRKAEVRLQDRRL